MIALSMSKHHLGRHGEGDGLVACAGEPAHPEVRTVRGGGMWLVSGEVILSGPSTHNARDSGRTLIRR